MQKSSGICGAKKWDIPRNSQFNTKIKIYTHITIFIHKELTKKKSRVKRDVNLYTIMNLQKFFK
jgi:hypothetical protein